MADPPPTVTGLWRHLPNAITVLRFFLAVIFFAMLTIWRGEARHGWYTDGGPPTPDSPEWPLLLAALVFILAAATDAVDGYLARRWGVVSSFGRVMDPFADKVLVLGAYICLAGPGFNAWIRTPSGALGVQISGVEPWMVVVILARELLVTSIRAVLEGQGVQFPADWSGKGKMILQSISVPVVLVTVAMIDASPGHLGSILIRALVWTTVGVTVLSGWPYIQRAMRAFRMAGPHT